VIEQFCNSKDDAIKANAVFTNSKIKWKSIYPEVKQWVDDSWETWENDMPEWLNMVVLQKISLDLLPEDAQVNGTHNLASSSNANASSSVNRRTSTTGRIPLAQLIQDKKASGRRNSLGGFIRDSVRASFSGSSGQR